MWPSKCSRRSSSEPASCANPVSTTFSRVPSPSGVSVNSTSSRLSSAGSTLCVGTQRDANRCGGSTRSTRPRTVPCSSQTNVASPPLRRSSSTESLNHPLICSGSVTTAHTISTGASMTISRSMRFGTKPLPPSDVQPTVAPSLTDAGAPPAPAAAPTLDTPGSGFAEETRELLPGPSRSHRNHGGLPDLERSVLDRILRCRVGYRWLGRRSRPHALTRALGGCQAAPGKHRQQCRSAGDQCERKGDFDRRSGKQPAPSLEHHGNRVQAGDLVHPAGEKVQRHVHRREEQGHEHRHLNQGPRLLGAQEHRDPDRPQRRREIHAHTEAKEAEELDAM